MHSREFLVLLIHFPLVARSFIVPTFLRVPSEGILAPRSNTLRGNFDSEGLELQPRTILELVAFTTTMIGAFSWVQGADERARREKWRSFENEEKQERELRRQRAYIEPKPFWSLEELKKYNGVNDMRGPLLIAVDGLVYNAYRGRHFYGPGCEYHIFAGRDATRLLAKGLLEEESYESSQTLLSLSERASLAAWVFTFKSKYDVVGRLEGAGPPLSESIEAKSPEFLP